MYGIDVRAFCDSDGDGVGDLDGVRDRLGYLDLLGVDTVALRPSSGREGAGEAFDPLLAGAHDAGLRVLVDLVAGHTGDGHEWFRAAVAAPPGSAERERYHFRPGRGPDGAEPPTNWRALDGGPSWTRLTGADGPGEWYLHLPGAGLPDLNWANPEIWDETEKALRFWCERGADGVALGLPHALGKPAVMADDPRPDRSATPAERGDPRLDHDDVHGVHRMIRAVLDHHPDRIALALVDVADPERFARYGRPDELHLAVRTDLARCDFDAARIRARVDRTLDAVRAVGGTPAWTLSDPDGPRPAQRHGSAARALAMTLVLLALPGAIAIEAGDELCLPQPAPPRPGDARTPFPWDAATTQLEDPDSALSLHRRALALRREHPGFTAFAGEGKLEWFGAPDGCLAFRRAGSTLVCALNTSNDPVPLPLGDVLLASGPVPPDRLPPDTAVWLI